ncbi:MAG: hypothetical protein JXO22_14550 [Phycisphaerae bacterium]|nr:hypothetical protein [Phycisphaerae bacterium]
MSADQTQDDAAHLPQAPATPAELIAGADEALNRIERRLCEIRVLLDQEHRQEQHRELPVTRLLGAVLQAFVVGLLAWACSDWVFQTASDRILVKLAFAAVLQLTALSAYVLMPRDR